LGWSNFSSTRSDLAHSCLIESHQIHYRSCLYSSTSGVCCEQTTRLKLLPQASNRLLKAVGQIMAQPFIFCPIPFLSHICPFRLMASHSVNLFVCIQAVLKCGDQLRQKWICSLRIASYVVFSSRGHQDVAPLFTPLTYCEFHCDFGKPIRRLFVDQKETSADMGGCPKDTHEFATEFKDLLGFPPFVGSCWFKKAGCLRLEPQV